MRAKISGHSSFYRWAFDAKENFLTTDYLWSAAINHFRYDFVRRQSYNSLNFSHCHFSRRIVAYFIGECRTNVKKIWNVMELWEWNVEMTEYPEGGRRHSTELVTSFGEIRRSIRRALVRTRSRSDARHLRGPDRILWGRDTTIGDAEKNIQCCI